LIDNRQPDQGRARIDQLRPTDPGKGWGIGIATLVALEKSGALPVRGLARTLQLVLAALEAKGVMLTPLGVALAGSASRAVKSELHEGY